jgi:HD-GYP domain-containing protein (c-di-GMP phosphodiesterase class II)
VDRETELPEAMGGPMIRIMPIILANNDKFHGSGHSHSDGEEIPVGARVIAVADEYDSLTSDDRPQRRTISPLHAKEVIVKLSGRDFDPGVVSAFVAAFNKGEMEIPEVVL